MSPMLFLWLLVACGGANITAPVEDTPISTGMRFLVGTGCADSCASYYDTEWDICYDSAYDIAYGGAHHSPLSAAVTRANSTWTWHWYCDDSCRTELAQATMPMPNGCSAFNASTWTITINGFSIPAYATAQDGLVTNDCSPGDDNKKLYVVGAIIFTVAAVATIIGTIASPITALMMFLSLYACAGCGCCVPATQVIEIDGPVVELVLRPGVGRGFISNSHSVKLSPV